ncbi:hypothetical protein ACHAPU_004721 [Fusarium lateritium]
MGDVYRDSRVYRDREWERDDGSSGDERYRKTTIRRYKVTPSRSDRFDRSSEFDDSRSHASRYGRASGDLVEQDRRSYAPDRPHSAFEGAPSHASFHEDRGRDTAPRSFIYDKEIERETYPPPPPMPMPMPMPAPSQAGDRPRAPVYAETKEMDRDWERRSRFDALFDDDVKVENQMVRTERRDNGEFRVEKRVEEHIDDTHGCDVERYRKETEYYTPYDPQPPPPPVIIRQRAPEPQRIIVQEAPTPAPVIISPRVQQQPGVVVIREKEPERQQMVRREHRHEHRSEHRHEHRSEHRHRPAEEEYYYRHEHRDSRGDRDFAIERYDRRRRDHGHYSDDDDYYVRRKVVRRREGSESPNHKRHLAEGALAGAGVTALFNSRRDNYGELPDNRGRKVIAGAALGALGTEALRRARSAYGDRWHDDDGSPDRSSRLKQGLGIAAVALAAAGAAKYYQSNKIEKEEAIRGRSRRRSRGYHSDDYSRSRSRSVIKRTTTKTKSTSRRRSLSTAAKAALGTVAAAGVAKHLRNRSKSSRGRSSSRSSSSRSRSRSRSKSKLRRGAEIAGAAVAAKAAHHVWKKRKEKKDGSDDSSDDEYYRRGPSRSRSRSRSKARSIRSERGTDPELGPVVEYGTDPLAAPAAASRGYETEAEARRRRRRRRGRSRSVSSGGSDHGKRSRSRFGAAAAAGAAAFGIKDYKEKKDREKREQRSRERRLELEREREREDERDRRGRATRSPSRTRSQSRSSKRYDDYNSRRPHSPPMASGGAGFPPYPTDPNPPPGAPYSNIPNRPSEFQPYVPQDYTGYPPPPPGPPRGLSTGPASYAPPPGPPGPPPPPGPPGPPPAGGPQRPDNVSNPVHNLGSRSLDEGASDRNGRGFKSRKEIEADFPTASLTESSDDEHPAKSVMFGPLSPKSSMTMKTHRAKAAAKEEKEKQEKQEQEAHDVLQGLVSAKPRSKSLDIDSYFDRRHLFEDEDPSWDDPVEVLPDRFDRSGRPLHGRATKNRALTRRQGDFEYQPRHKDDWDVKGAWQVAGTDGQAVDQIVRGVTGALEGKSSWLGLLGTVLGGLQEPERQQTIDDRDHEERRRRRTHRD